MPASLILVEHNNINICSDAPVNSFGAILLQQQK